MPILERIEGFEDECLSILGFGSSNLSMNTVVTGTPTFITGRTGGKAVRFAASANHTLDRRAANPGQYTIFSGWFRVSGIPTANVLINDCGIGGSGMGLFVSTIGTAYTSLDSGALPTTSGPFVADGNWHCAEWYVDSGVNPWFMKWRIDGVEQRSYNENATAVTSGTSQMRWGHGATHGDITTDWDDCVYSHRQSDYPIGPVRVYWLRPNADGTHNAGAVIKDNNDNVIDGTTFPAWSLMADWPANTTDFVKQSGNGAGNYAEVQFEDIPTTENVLGVSAVAAMFAENTTSNHGIGIVTGAEGNQLAVIYNSDMSETSLHFRRTWVPDIPVTRVLDHITPQDVNAMRARIGFSTNAATDPYWSALAIAVAVSDNNPATVGTRSVTE